MRFNYLAATRPKRRALRLEAIAVDDRVRGPLTALAAIVALTLIIGVVQLERLHAARLAFTRAQERLTVSRMQLGPLLALRSRVAGEMHLRDALDAMRRTSLARIDEFAWIGNRLPAQSWLRSLRAENGAYWLDGNSKHADAVGATLLALQDAAHPTNPELITFNDDPASPAARVSYSLHLQAPR